MRWEPGGGLAARRLVAATCSVLAGTAMLVAVPAVVAPAQSAGLLRLPDCADRRTVRVLHSGAGVLESVTPGPAGESLYATDPVAGRVIAFEASGARRVVAEVPVPGGVDVRGDRLVVGVDQVPLLRTGSRRLLLVDPTTGSSEEWAAGLTGVNGVSVLSDGSAFTATEEGAIDRVDPDGHVTRAWARLPSPNGLRVDERRGYVYVSQTFSPGVVWRISLDRPDEPEVLFRAPLLDAAAVLDGMDLDAEGRLHVAAYGAGAVWRIDPQGRGCVLARDPRLLTVSMVSVGAGPADPAYAVTHTGLVLELTRPR